MELGGKGVVRNPGRPSGERSVRWELRKRIPCPPMKRGRRRRRGSGRGKRREAAPDGLRYHLKDERSLAG